MDCGIRLSCELVNKSAHGARQMLPEGKRLPAGWTAVPIGARGQELILTWERTRSFPRLRLSADCLRFRITVAVEMREMQRIEVFLARSGSTIGWIDVRCAYVFQPFELEMSLEMLDGIYEEGIGLRSAGTDDPLWIFDELDGEEERQSFTPHLWMGKDGRRIEGFLRNMQSLAALQPFGWLEGCVLDGMYDLRLLLGEHSMEQAIDRHLRQFVDDSGRLRYEDLYGRPSDGSFSGIESTLPVGVMAKLHPDCPLVQEAAGFWLVRSPDANGSVTDGNTITAEGAYTVAYPMAAAAVGLRREKLAKMAIVQLLNRRDALTDGPDLYLRSYGDGRPRTFRNWARGYAWYMLGLTRTWLELHRSPYAGLPGMKEMAEEIRRIAEAALTRREPDGLWPCFLGEPETGAETSGSAGIAAALALGARSGLLDSRALMAAEESLRRLETHLTPDGFLSGVSQHNAGGEELQRGGYRVISQMGMGLMAQLYAAVNAQGSKEERKG
ncbi:glycoside hydrolase family 88 protein [Cohnella hongkongensis]|uniref:Glycoside hydrolase family 88 protein n=1 Tax=Cohnella hongkongensis TaxID=178337 RepID=A0ABV9FBI0_9BACL